MATQRLPLTFARCCWWQIHPFTRRSGRHCYSTAADESLAGDLIIPDRSFKCIQRPVDDECLSFIVVALMDFLHCDASWLQSKLLLPDRPVNHFGQLSTQHWLKHYILYNQPAIMLLFCKYLFLLKEGPLTTSNQLLSPYTIALRLR